jgi:hypothetical protein
MHINGMQRFGFKNDVIIEGKPKEVIIEFFKNGKKSLKKTVFAGYESTIGFHKLIDSFIARVENSSNTVPVNNVNHAFFEFTFDPKAQKIIVTDVTKEMQESEKQKE